MYHSLMENTKQKRTTISYALAESLGRSWLIRRVTYTKGVYNIKDIYGQSELSLYSDASKELNELTQGAGMNYEALVLIHKRTNAHKLSKHSFATLLQDFKEMIKKVDAKHVCRVGYISDGLHEDIIQGVRNHDMPPCWDELLKSMAGASSLLKDSAHLLFVGSEMEELMAMQEYRGLLSHTNITGEYKTLPVEISNRSKHIEESWQAKMMTKGASLESLDKVVAVIQGMSSRDEHLDSYKNNALALPWKRANPIIPTLNKVKQVLDNELFGLDDVKNEVLKAIAGSLISSQGTFNPPRILLHGTPGTGKTAIAKAIAKALQVPFYMIAMNGISTAVSIVGVELCYSSPQMGEIMRALTVSGVSNPVVLLDEIEKVGHDDKHGDPLHALHQALDPDENKRFTDVYFSFPYDVSQMFFIATSNDISGLPDSLLDRFLTIEVPEYSLQEKRAIMPYLVKQVVSERNLHCAPKFTAQALILMEERLLPDSSLRKIKASIWRMLCEGALASRDIQQYGKALVVDEYAAKAVIGSCSTEKPRKIGFV